MQRGNAQMRRPDDFAIEIKELLAKRVGMRCSNPNCRQPTSGPSTNQRKSINIGVAAHITAAESGGPRYDESLSSEERRSPDNGIWCCQNCGKLVDNDALRYPVELLLRWKNLSEEAARLSIERPPKEPSIGFTDDDLIRFYAQCFDRPAFQDPFVQEGSMSAFDQAIEDTITAINTGCLRSRDGHKLSQAKGKAYVQNGDWRQELDTVVELLRAIRSRYELGRKLKLIWSDGDRHCINDRHTADWIDQTREEVLQIFGRVANEAGVVTPRGSGNRPHRHIGI
jgi:hypothetical protein